MLSILSSPIFRKILSALIVGGIGFYFGFTLKENQLQDTRKEKHIAIGKYEQLTSHYNQLHITKDTLLAVVIKLAKQERIKVENHISDTKVKDGSTLSFVPKTRAEITSITTKSIQEIEVPNILQPAIPNNIPTLLQKEEKKPSWLRRLFTRKKIK